MTKGDRVVGYVRVSTADQGSHGLSLAAQREAVERECRRRGWLLVGIEEDVQSGKSTKNRPGLRRAVAACQNGDAVAVVFLRLDRVTRSLVDFARLAEDAERAGYSLVAADGSVDMTTPHGRAMAGMSAVFAQLERDLISERTKLAMVKVKKRTPAELKKLGKKPVGRPPAQVNDSLRRQVKSARKVGKTWSEIARELEAAGEKTATGGSRWEATMVKRLVA